MHTFRPVANGIRTDHPVPGIPFVDDAHIPVQDPRAVEAVGRGVAEGMWGRWDEQDEGWLAFTTDPLRHDLGWALRHHPDHGTTVLLYRHDDASAVHMDWWGRPLLYRSGGYWWDGTTWYRPGQVYDAASEAYDHRPARAAVTVTAADLLDDSADAAAGRLLKITNLDPQAAPATRFSDDLALWASLRAQRGAATPLAACVVTLSAPELAADHLVGIPEMARIGGIGASTLRSYIARGEGDVPPEQSVVHGRSMWARPVAADWAEQRQRSPETVTATVAEAEDTFSLPVGQADLRRRLAKMFFSWLWERPERRKRWALRHRTEPAVAQVADELGWNVAVSLDRIIPTGDLATTLRYALLGEFARGRRTDPEGAMGFHGITPAIAKTLDWLVRHDPSRAQHMIGELVGQAEREMEIPRAVTARSLRTALSLDGKLTEAARNDYLDRVLPPSETS
ncbi:hypothetical protein CLV63_112106 [Murinocardiopsis flavida]|uniref:Uncharacterized protein n=1 Tax=Murinocardiopsis flavida TaxID=645275 RepID=A0A2P8DG80_9ACTN|nr:hypothetical protein [Murinocardiopsis flavida]PSK96224.1 hypothetical protein CLV63_112106 [Murinocardiopsis flavida]